MSERQDSTCQKYELPKSLQDTEDAEFVWSMIIDRFPNAAPLLCEMEAVIDRAEELLQQIRVPCREIETSTSFCTPDSEVSTLMFSARASISTDNDNVEDNGNGNNVAETQVSQSTICEENAASTQALVFKEQDTEHRLSDSIVQCSIDEKSSSVKECDSKLDHASKHTRSLEEWGRVVDTALRGSIQNKEQSRKIENETKSVERDESKTINDHQKSCIILHRQERCSNVGDSAMLIDSDENVRSQDFIEIKDDSANVSLKVNTGGSGDESSLNQRTPLNILEEYSKRCGVPVVYKNVTDGPYRHKSNACAIQGCLGGFTATCRGQSEEYVKNDLAAKILQMIANYQMKYEKLSPLENLTKEEMTEVINLGVDSPRETAQTKLYQLCLKKGEPLPKYRVNKEETYQGYTFIATCIALGYITEGRGVREHVAKKAAADELYHLYCQDTKEPSKVLFLEL